MKKRKNHSPEFKARVALEAIREEMTLAELSKKYSVHRTQIGTWKRAAIENMATAFTRRGAAPEQVSAAEVDKLHSKIGQLVIDRDFLANASHQLLGTRGKKWCARIIGSACVGSVRC
jgi:transposase